MQNATIQEKGLSSAGFNLVFFANTNDNRRRLNAGSIYLTVFKNASIICQSIYLGDDQWKNPETMAICGNHVAYFAEARVFNIQGFPGWPIDEYKKSI